MQTASYILQQIRVLTQICILVMIITMHLSLYLSVMQLTSYHFSSHYFLHWLDGYYFAAPLSRRTINTTSGGNTVTNKKKDGMSSTPTVRIFTFEELKAATRNFHGDSILGDGGFGTVFKGRIHEKSSAKEGSGSLVAVKKLNHQSMQGFQEWQVIIHHSVQVVPELEAFSFSFALTMKILIIFTFQCMKIEIMVGAIGDILPLILLRKIKY